MIADKGSIYCRSVSDEGLVYQLDDAIENLCRCLFDLSAADTVEFHETQTVVAGGAVSTFLARQEFVRQVRFPQQWAR